MLGRSCMRRLSSRLLATGTYVSERMNAPSMAKNTVSAMGRNILPSIPTRVISGIYTIMMMISPKAALCLMRDVEKCTSSSICFCVSLNGTAVPVARCAM